MLQPDVTPTPQPPEKHTHMTQGQIFAVGAVIIALILCAFALGSAIGSGDLVIEDKTPIANEDIKLPDGKGDGTDNETPVPEVIDDEDEDDAVSTQDVLAVDWVDLEDQTEVTFSGSLQNMLVSWGGANFTYSLPQLHALDLGVVKGGDYDAYRVIDNIVVEQGMGEFHTHYFTLRKPNSSYADVLLQEISFIEGGKIGPVGGDQRDTNTNQDGKTFTSIMKANFKGRLSTATLDAFAELGPTVTAKSGLEDTYAFLNLGEQLGYTSIGGSFGAEFLDSSYTDYPIVGTLTNGLEVRKYKKENFFTVTEPGFTAWYDATLSFWPVGSFFNVVPDVTLNGQKTTTNYMKGQMGGCGFSSVVHVADKSEVGQLKEVGFSNAKPSDKLYAPVSYDTDYYRDEFTNWQRMAGEDKTIADFAALTPFFYFTDEFGRFIEFSSTEVVPPGECGKPVIYLYPETTTSLNVQLAPVGGFTITEPDYGTGWNVVAKPNGELTNSADGKTYPYLFWEGLGGLYSEPTRFDVVAKDEVPSYLTSTLAELGLNAQETADFMEFWVPRMTSAPYYKIGFHGTATMDQIAPLTISEAPDTIIRILMDYQELEAPIPAQPPVFPTPPAREGFTVIEWGGVLRHY